MSGFVAISRRFFAHEFWTKKREYSEAEAWLDLIQWANWQDGRQLVKGKLIEVTRGQLLASNRFLQERWGWKSLTKVQSYLRLLSEQGMIRSEDMSVTSRITICKYEDYNSFEVRERSEKGQAEVRERSEKSQTEVREKVKSNNNKQEETKKQEKQPYAQAGGFDFEKLANRVGGNCARLLIQSSVGELMEVDRKRLMAKWLEYRLQKGSEVTTLIEMTAVVKQFTEHPVADIEAAMEKSFSAGWKVLVIEAAKEKTAFPNYWKAGIEEENRWTPEQTNAYYRHLMGLGFVREVYQGKTYWTKPKQEARTGLIAINDVN